MDPNQDGGERSPGDRTYRYEDANGDGVLDIFQGYLEVDSEQQNAIYRPTRDEWLYFVIMDVFTENPDRGALVLTMLQDADVSLERITPEYIETMLEGLVDGNGDALLAHHEIQLILSNLPDTTELSATVEASDDPNTVGIDESLPHITAASGGSYNVSYPDRVQDLTQEIQDAIKYGGPHIVYTSSFDSLENPNVIVVQPGQLAEDGQSPNGLNVFGPYRIQIERLENGAHTVLLHVHGDLAVEVQLKAGESLLVNTLTGEFFAVTFSQDPATGERAVSDVRVINVDDSIDIYVPYGARGLTDFDTQSEEALNPLPTPAEPTPTTGNGLPLR
jgi:hypothetical protein